VPVYLAGSKVEGIVGWAPVSGEQSMSLTIYSYDGKIIVGIAADTVLVPGFPAIVDDFSLVFDELAAETDVRRPTLV
jgi:diacylglycerol O-acyltransferase